MEAPKIGIFSLAQCSQKRTCCVLLLLSTCKMRTYCVLYYRMILTQSPYICKNSKNYKVNVNLYKLYKHPNYDETIAFLFPDINTGSVFLLIR